MHNAYLGGFDGIASVSVIEIGSFYVAKAWKQIKIELLLNWLWKYLSYQRVASPAPIEESRTISIVPKLNLSDSLTMDRRR